MALLQTAALQGYRNYTKKVVNHARYKVGDTWYTADLSNVEVLQSGIVEISFMIELDSGSGTVTKVELYNRTGELWFSKSESLDLSNVSEGFLYVVQIEIKEVST